MSSLLLQSNEYDKLCAEIARNNESLLQVLKTALTFCSALIAAALALDIDAALLLKSYLFVPVSLIFIPSFYLMAGYLKAIYRVGMYIAVFYENTATGITFENKLLAFDNEVSLTKSRHNITWIIGGILLTVFLISWYFVAMYNVVPPDYLGGYALINILCIALMINAIHRYVKCSPEVLKPEYKKRWEKIKEDSIVNSGIA